MTSAPSATLWPGPLPVRSVVRSVEVNPAPQPGAGPNSCQPSPSCRRKEPPPPDLVPSQRNGRTVRYELASPEVRDLLQALVAVAGS
jgi:hypothetical protein